MKVAFANEIDNSFDAGNVIKLYNAKIPLFQYPINAIALSVPCYEPGSQLNKKKKKNHNKPY